MENTWITPVSKGLFDLHVAALQAIDNELQRLHERLERGSGDDEVTQEQIGLLQEELCRLSHSLSDVEARCSTVGHL